MIFEDIYNDDTAMVADITIFSLVGVSNTVEIFWPEAWIEGKLYFTGFDLVAGLALVEAEGV
jgi:hypothetical protein